MMKHYTFFIVLVLFSFVFVDSYAFTNGNSEKKIAPNFYPYGQGILEFQESEASTCYYAIPRLEVKSVVPSKGDVPLDLNEISNNFFIVLRNHSDDSFQYLQIELTNEGGIPSYLLDFKKGDEKLRGEFYVDYKNLIVVESDSEEKPISDESHQKYFEGKSKDITYSMHTFGPGHYDFGTILLKSDNSSWIKNDKCVLRLDWPVRITDDGKIISSTPAAKLGILSDFTAKFPPLVQYKYGVNTDSIECKSGLRIILQNTDDSGNQRPSCVKPDTAAKLIQRGWTKNS